jgi:hypothetical protein
VFCACASKTSIVLAAMTRSQLSVRNHCNELSGKIFERERLVSGVELHRYLKGRQAKNPSSRLGGPCNWVVSALGLDSNFVSS